MNLAYKFPTLFWDCACLIANSGGDDSSLLSEDEDEIIDAEGYTIYDTGMEDFTNEDDDDEEEVNVVKKKKKKTKPNDYGKIATAIGVIKTNGGTVAPPNINKSTYSFYPDVESNTILHGFSGITRVNDELIQKIFANRPYTSIEDFYGKIHLNKLETVNLIKSGSLDEFGDRYQLMVDYIEDICGAKNTLNLRNLSMMVKMGLFPTVDSNAGFTKDTKDFTRDIKNFNYNVYLKKKKKNGMYALDNVAFYYYEQNFDIDLLIPSSSQSSFDMPEKVWLSYYTKSKDKFRDYIKANLEQLLEQVNTSLFNAMWDKYASGSISKWEMDSVSYYSHDHELAKAKLSELHVVDFNSLPAQTQIKEVKVYNGKPVPLYNIVRIAGTVLDKTEGKSTVTLLTTTGVVTVQIFGAVYLGYNKQISELNPETGKKKIKEKSWFSKGNKLIISGIRRDNVFTAKKYKKTPWHLVEKIESIDEDGNMEITTERYKV